MVQAAALFLISDPTMTGIAALIERGGTVRKLTPVFALTQGKTPKSIYQTMNFGAARRPEQRLSAFWADRRRKGYTTKRAHAGEISEKHLPDHEL